MSLTDGPVTVRFRNGRQVLAVLSNDVLVPREFKTFKQARRVLVALNLATSCWSVMGMKDGKFYVAKRAIREADPTAEEIEDRKRELRLDHLKQMQDLAGLDSLQSTSSQLEKYRQIAHQHTYHDPYDDIRTGQKSDRDLLCDCPYWEHERRNPEC